MYENEILCTSRFLSNCIKNLIDLVLSRENYFTDISIAVGPEGVNALNFFSFFY